MPKFRVLPKFYTNVVEPPADSMIQWSRVTHYSIINIFGTTHNESFGTWGREFSDTNYHSMPIKEGPQPGTLVNHIQTILLTCFISLKITNLLRNRSYHPLAYPDKLLSYMFNFVNHSISQIFATTSRKLSSTTFWFIILSLSLYFLLKESIMDIFCFYFCWVCLFFFWIITFCPINYQLKYWISSNYYLMIFFSFFVSQMDGQRREKFFCSIFAPILGGYKCHYSDLKWGQKWKKKISPLTVSFNLFD